MKESGTPSVQQFTDALVAPIFKEERPALILYTEEKNSQLEATFTQIARAHRQNAADLMFVKSGSSSAIERSLHAFGPGERAKLPRISIIRKPKAGSKTKMLKLHLENVSFYTSAEDINKFASDFIENNSEAKKTDEL